MKAKLFVLALIATPLAGCLTFNTAPPARINAPIEQVMQHARNGNWMVRVRADSTIIGRVSLPGRSHARVGNVAIDYAGITSIERRYDRDVGGTQAGVYAGGILGVLLGFAGVSWWEYGHERKCTILCQFKIVAPTAGTIALVGGLVGRAIDAPTHGWTTIWQR